MSRTSPTRRDILGLGTGLAAWSLPAARCLARLAPPHDGEASGKDERLYLTALKKEPLFLEGRKLNWVLVAVDTAKNDAAAELPGVVGAMLWRSRDGRTLAWSRNGSDGSLWVRDVAGQERRVYDFGDRRSSVSGAFSPDGRQLVVSVGEMDQGRDLRNYTTWRLNTDGTGLVELPLPKTDRVQDWSPDGEKLLVDSTDSSSYGRDAKWHVMLYGTDGKRPRRLTSGRSYTELCYSPDGRRIAYVGTSADDRRSGLGLMLADGSEPRQLLDSEEQGYSRVCWSPDAQRLAARVVEYVQVDLPDGGRGITIGASWIEVIDPDAAGRRRIALPEGYDIGSPAWY